MFLKTLSRPLVCLLGVWGLSGCAEQRDPINRVQADALAKSFFVGDIHKTSDDPVFLSRNMVVDASENQSLVGINMSSGLERIRWQITENMLIARRAYSLTKGDNKGTGTEPNGDVLGVYKIKGHFDIRNAYNSSTGEELNVVEENASDRVWSDREYFRVDWSQNLVNTPTWGTMFFGQTFGDIKLTPISFVENDPKSANAPHFELEDGYLDITSHFLVEPENVQFDWGQLPLCMLMGFMTGTAIYSCDPQEAVVRAAYWRLDKADADGDFEPFENTQAPLDIVGNPGGIGDSASLGDVTAPLETYDPGYSFTDAGYHRFMAIHNLWQQSHQTRGSCKVNSDCVALLGRADSECLTSGTCSVPCSYDARSDANANGTDDQCEADITRYNGSLGSQCSARNRCTIPYRDRDVKPITYFVNRETPDALQDKVNGAGRVIERGATEDLAFTWSQALSVAVAHARETECRRTSQGSEEQRRRDCHAEYFKLNSDGVDETQMVSYGGWGLTTPLSTEHTFDICHNPVRSYDPAACGKEGTSARDGDVRKNFLIYWPYRTEAGYGGLGNWRGDPVTGQIIGAAATTIGASAARSAARSRDIALVALGELSLTDITDGVSAFRFEKELRDGRAPKQWTSEELHKRTQQFDIKHLAQNVSLGFAGGLAGSADSTDNNLQAAVFKQSLQLNSGLTNKNLLRFQTLSKPLLGSKIETDLIDSNWLADGLGMNPNTRITDELLPTVSPLRGQAPGTLSQMTQRVQQELGARGVCHLDDGMDSAASVGSPDIANLGAYYRKKYPDLSGAAFADQVYEDLWKEAYKGIALHEIGHSLGLLHNFTSSFDAMNYNPQYWQLRSNEGQSAATCGGVPRAGAQDTCMGPRYLDPETPDELGRGSEPRPGLTYFGHTSTMEYQTARFFESVGLGQYDVMAMGALYGRVLETLDSRDFSATAQRRISPVNMTQLTDEWQLFDGNVHYTELGRVLKLFAPERCRSATDAEKAQGEWRVVHGKVCSPPRKDYGHWDDFVNTTPDGVPGKKIRIPSDTHAPSSGNLRWQYRFGGDISNSYLHVNPFDSGADAYEVSKEAIEKFDYEYPFQYFRAKRRAWQTYRLPSQASRAFFERLRSYHWVIASESAFFNEVAPTRFQSLANDDNGLRPYLLAETEMFNAVSRVLLLPEPGAYTNNSSLPSGILDVATSRTGSFTLDASDARFISPSFESTPDVGGSWKYSDFYRRSGFSVEKSLAARALTNGTPTLYVVSRDVALDDRNLHISFRTDMPRGVDRMLGGILSEDWKTIAPIVENSSNPEVKMRDLLSEAPTALEARTKELFPNLGYSQQLPTLVYAYLFGSMSEDITLSTKMRIWLQGSISGELAIPESEQVRFADPDTGITYVARRFGTEELYGKQVDTGIGSRMLIRANELLSQAYQVEEDRDGASILNEFGQPEVVRDNGIAARRNDAEKVKLYRKYVTLLDAAVRVGTLVGHGPVGE